MEDSLLLGWFYYGWLAFPPGLTGNLGNLLCIRCFRYLVIEKSVVIFSLMEKETECSIKGITALIKSNKVDTGLTYPTL